MQIIVCGESIDNSLHENMTANKYMSFCSCFAHINDILRVHINEEGARMKAVNTVALLLIIIGGLNWGLVGLFEYNLVDSLFGEGSALARVVYTLVGIAALYQLVVWATSLSAKEDVA